MQKITLELDCILSEEELLKKGQEIASKMVKYDSVEEQKKAEASEATSTLKGLRAEVTVLAKVIKAKKETRVVKCVVEMNTPETGTKRITRTDTNEIVSETAMTMEERQTNLFGDDAKVAAKNASGAVN